MARKTRIKVTSVRFWVLVFGVLAIAFCIMQSKTETLLANQEIELSYLEQQREQLLVEISDAERKLAFSKSDDYIERIARSQLGLVMPDEVLYVESYEE